MLWRTGTHCCHSHICSRIVNMTSMRSYKMFIGLNGKLENLRDVLFCKLWLIYLRCLRWKSLHVNKELLILLDNMQHWQPHQNKYWSVISLNWCGHMSRKVESLLTKLFLCILFPSVPLFVVDSQCYYVVLWLLLAIIILELTSFLIEYL